MHGHFSRVTPMINNPSGTHLRDKLSFQSFVIRSKITIPLFFFFFFVRDNAGAANKFERCVTIKGVMKQEVEKRFSEKEKTRPSRSSFILLLRKLQYRNSSTIIYNCSFAFFFRSCYNLLIHYTLSFRKQNSHATASFVFKIEFCYTCNSSLLYS